MLSKFDNDIRVCALKVNSFCRTKIKQFPVRINKHHCTVASKIFQQHNLTLNEENVYKVNLDYLLTNPFILAK